METNPILKRSNTTNVGEIFLWKNNTNNRQSFRKKTLPKLNISNLSNSIGNYQDNLGRFRSKTLKRKITLSNIKPADSNNLTREIKEAREIKDLEKIYEKWLNQEKTDTKPYEFLLTEEMDSSRNEEKLSNNNNFLKNNKKNLSDRESALNKSKESKGKNSNINNMFNNSKFYKNKIKLKEIKKKEEEKIKKEFDEEFKKEEEKRKNEEEEKKKKELEELAKKEKEEKMRKELEERAKKEEEEEEEMDDMVGLNVELEEMTRKELEAVNRKEMKRKKLEEKKRKELERKKRGEAEEKIRKELEENMIKEVKENIIIELEDNMKKEFEEIIKVKTEELIKIQMEETIWEEIDEEKKIEMIEQMKKELMIKINEEYQEKISKELNEDVKLELEEVIKNKMNEWNKKTRKRMLKKDEEKMIKEIKEKTKEEFGEKLKKKMEEENKIELEQNMKTIIEQKVKTLEENIIKEIEEKKKLELEEKEKEIEEQKRIEEEERIRKELEEKKKKELEEKINEYNKQNQELDNIKKLKNEIANKVLSEVDNLSKGNISQKSETKKRERKITKTKDLKDIIKNANLFLSDKYKYSTSNLIKKFEYTKEINRIIQNEILENKYENLITPDEAVYYIENNIIRFYGYFGSELIYRNINTFIEKTPTNEILREITFKILTSGLAFQKVFHIIIENKDLKSHIAEDERLFYKYFDELKKAISKRFQISEDDIFYFSSDIYSYEQNLLIYDSNNTEGLEDLLKLESLNVSTSLLLNNIILSPCVFEQNFCKTLNTWSKKKSRRGGWEYRPPLGWFGISMKVSKKFEKNMTWLGKQNINGEWLVAYHAIGSGNVFNRILDILDGNLKNEEIKLFKREKNTGNNKNKYPLCGEGLYCSPDIQNVEKFAEKKSLGYFNIKFQFALMTRVNPNKIRNPGIFPVCWILSGNNEEIRPYRLLFKICTG